MKLHQRMWHTDIRTRAGKKRIAYLYATQLPHLRKLTFDIERSGKWLYVTLVVFVWAVGGSFYFESWTDAERSEHGA